jgi:hypothetical protein
MFSCRIWKPPPFSGLFSGVCRLDEVVPEIEGWELGTEIEAEAEEVEEEEASVISAGSLKNRSLAMERRRSFSARYCCLLCVTELNIPSSLKAQSSESTSMAEERTGLTQQPALCS